ncbi:MAG: hypothetical protein WC870_02000 [Candidatus Paceibacterota bacterium]
MNKQKIILSILGLGVVIGLGFVAVKLNNDAIEQKNVENPSTETPIKPVENTAGVFLEFGKTITFNLNEKITFSDGLEMTLKEINDSRCPEGVQCIWMGEISGAFVVSGGKFTSAKEFRLGTVNNKSISLEGYVFSLKDATKTSIMIEVVKN